MEHDTNELGQPVGNSLPEWRGACLPKSDVLLGSYCKLMPMVVNQHGDALYEAFFSPYRESDWTYLPANKFSSK